MAKVYAILKSSAKLIAVAGKWARTIRMCTVHKRTRARNKERVCACVRIIAENGARTQSDKSKRNPRKYYSFAAAFDCLISHMAHFARLFCLLVSAAVLSA